jgi:hypothetical protein
VEDGTLEIAENLNGAQKFIEVVGETGFGVAFLDIGEEIELGFFSLGLRRQTAIHVQEPVPDEPADCRDNRQSYEETTEPSWLAIRGEENEDRRTYRVVKFIVNVRLIENSVKSHVGRVMVQKVMAQYRMLGMTWKTKENTHPIHPTMVEGAGGGSGGGGR